MPRFVSAILCLVALAAADAGQAANPAFRISIDADTWRLGKKACLLARRAVQDQGARKTREHAPRASSPGVMSSSSHLNLCSSKYRVYMRSSMLAQSQLSVPPAPAWMPK